MESAMGPMGSDTRLMEGDTRPIEGERLFRATFDRAAIGIAHLSPQGRWLRVNRRLCDLLGYSRAELASLTFQELTHPDDLDADLDHVRRLLAGEIEEYELDKRYLRKLFGGRATACSSRQHS